VAQSFNNLSEALLCILRKDGNFEEKICIFSKLDFYQSVYIPEKIWMKMKIWNHPSFENIF